MKKHFIYWLAAFVIVVVGCQKELSFEGSNTPAQGSLQDDVTGDCLPKTINGTYLAGSPLVPATNTIAVQINVTKTGAFVVTTDTVNGFYFRATGTFTTLGANNVILRGNGTPFAAIPTNFVVNFDTTFCDIQVPVTSPGIGTLAGAPGACAPIVVNGGYSPGVALTAANNAVVQVNVTTAGLINITTDTVAGIWFSFSGSLPLGAGQNVTLLAHGSIPAATPTGPQTFKVKLGTSQCTFVVTIVGPAAGTLDGAPTACTPVTVNGNYTKNIALVPGTNTVQIRIDVTTAGAATITAAASPSAGFTFSFSGTVAVGNDQLITLDGVGTPTGSGPTTFTVTFGSSTCTFSINIGDGLGKCDVDCTTAFEDGLYETNLQLNCSNTITVQVNVTALGPYTITSTPVNGMTFTATGTFTMLGGPQPILFVGSGTPGPTSATYNIPIPGTTPCSIPLFVDVPFGPIAWKFTKTNAPNTIYQGQFDFGSLDPSPLPPGVIYTFEGSNSNGSDALIFALVDANGTIANNETYSTSAVTGNTAGFSYTLPSSTNCSDTYSADPSISGVTIIFTVSNHNTVTQTITGTYAGTAKNGAGQTITIATGTFTGQY